MLRQRRPLVVLAGVVVVAVASLLATPGRAEQGRAHRPNPSHRSIQRQLAEISAKLEALYVPFRVEIAGGLCDSAVAPSSNPRILVDSDGTDTFVLTSILLKRGPQNPVDFLFLTVNAIAINGTYFATRTGNLFDPLFGEFAVPQSADILGMPVRRGGLIQDAEPGGNVPHQIVADGGGSEDVRVELFCRSDEQDLDIETILVAGWKRPGDTVTVQYVPDN